MDLGIKIYEKATAVSTPVVAASGIPYAVGCAPVHAAGKPGAVGTPVLATSWSEAVEKLGFSYDWKKYPLCEVIYSHFQLFSQQPVVFCNLYDPASMRKSVAERAVEVLNHAAALPFDTIHDGTLVVKSGENTLAEDEDFTVVYDEKKDVCNVELLSTGAYYDAATLQIASSEANPGAVTKMDIVEGVGKIDECMTAVGVIPDIILAPGWSHDSVVAAVMAAKCEGINGLFRGKAIIDVDCSETGVREYSALTAWKNKQNMVDLNQVLCWPQVKLGDYQFHMSTQLAGLMASVDSGNAGVPYESPSNKNLKMDACVLEDGTEVNLTWDQVNLCAGSWGIVVPLNFMSMGWVAKGNYTACYPANTDVKDYFLCVSRMFDWVGNTMVRTFWSKLDKPMTRLLIDNILSTCNIWLNGLTSMQYILGGRVEMLEAENPLTDLMQGIVRFHVFLTPPSPAQRIEFTLEYDVNYIQSALAG